jgi:hypothetical protein
MRTSICTEKWAERYGVSHPTRMFLRTPAPARPSDWGLGADINLYGGNERKLRVEWDYYKPDNVYVKNINSLTANLVFFFSDN